MEGRSVFPFWPCAVSTVSHLVSVGDAHADLQRPRQTLYLVLLSVITMRATGVLFLLTSLRSKLQSELAKKLSVAWPCLSSLSVNGLMFFLSLHTCQIAWRESTMLIRSWQLVTETTHGGAEPQTCLGCRVSSNHWRRGAEMPSLSEKLPSSFAYSWQYWDCSW